MHKTHRAVVRFINFIRLTIVEWHSTRPEPIMLFKLPIKLLSNAQNFPYYAPIIPSCVSLSSKFAHIKLCLDHSIRVSNASVNVLLAYSTCGDCSIRVYRSLTKLFFTT